MQKAETFLTSAWQRGDKWLTALRPLSKVYEFASDYHKLQYETGKKPIYKAPIPVLVIGNITVGGAGKTPLLIALVTLLQNKGVNVGVISRGFGGNEKLMPALVTLESTPDEVGDEPCLIVTSTNVPMAVCPNRGQAIDLLVERYPNLQLIISDDGLQHYALYRDEEWIVVDAERGFGNGKLLPEGFLREPVSRLENATVIYHYANEANASNSPHTHTMYLKLGELVQLIDNHKTFDKTTKKVHALTGIGYPTRFFNSLKTLGFELIEHSKPDHYVFELADITPLQDFPIIITAKDAVKIKHLINADTAHYFENIWVLPVVAQLSNSTLELMDDFLKKFVSKS